MKTRIVFSFFYLIGILTFFADHDLKVTFTEPIKTILLDTTQDELIGFDIHKKNG